MSTTATRPLFMNGITVNVPRDTVLEFFYTKDVCRASRKVALAITSKRVVEFNIGGVSFRTKAEIVEEFPQILFAVKLSEMHVKRDCVTTVELKGSEFESPELFPLVFDFLLRCYKFKFGRSGEVVPSPPPSPALRTVRLNHRQSKLLDEIEKQVFGIDRCGDLCETTTTTTTKDVLLLLATGPRYYIDHEKRAVCIAKPPPGVEVLPHMCIDPLVVHFVLEYHRLPQPKKKARPTENQKSLIETLMRRYPGVILDDLRLWGIVEIPRGEPFLLRAASGGFDSASTTTTCTELVVDFLAGDDVLVA